MADDFHPYAARTKDTAKISGRNRTKGKEEREEDGEGNGQRRLPRSLDPSTQLCMPAKSVDCKTAGVSVHLSEAPTIYLSVCLIPLDPFLKGVQQPIFKGVRLDPVRLV
mmetsp:Transcript_26002/g.50983  ORF Transcript_26002/g.50983 Transcript_26002/m.50983 type:complete len:109 (-) Transcript_26002:114-440(-)